MYVDYICFYCVAHKYFAHNGICANVSCAHYFAHMGFAPSCPTLIEHLFEICYTHFVHSSRDNQDNWALAVSLNYFQMLTLSSCSFLHSKHSFLKSLSNRERSNCLILLAIYLFIICFITNLNYLCEVNHNLHSIQINQQ